MKEKRLDIAWKLRNSLISKRKNLKEATAFIDSLGTWEAIVICPPRGHRDFTFTVPSRLAKDVLGVMHTLLAQDLKAAEEVFKRL